MLLATHRPPPPRPLFASILRADTNVLRIPRRLDADLAARLATLAQQSTFAHEARLDIAALDVGPLLASIDDDVVRAFLTVDIGHLSRQLGATLGRQHLHAKLYVKRTDGCRKIHVDHVTLRLVCTYAGPGTDWLPDQDLLRHKLGRSTMELAAANRSVIRDGASLQRCDAGDVILLKGEKYPGNAGRGAAHRSPPVGTSGTARLVLKLDENKCGC